MSRSTRSHSYSDSSFAPILAPSDAQQAQESTSLSASSKSKPKLAAPKFRSQSSTQHNRLSWRQRQAHLKHDSDGGSGVTDRTRLLSHGPHQVEAEHLSEDWDLQGASIIELALFCFFLISGGPYGAEGLVDAGGPGYALLGLMIWPIIFGIPQALMTAEMSTMFPMAGSYVVWGAAAFGPVGGWLNGHISVLTNLTDISLYPVLALSYIEELTDLSDVEWWSVVLGSVVLIVWLNIMGVDIVGKASAIFALIVISPFAVQLVQAGFEGRLHASDWVKTRPIKWRLFINLLYWNNSGLDGVSCLASEVQNPQHTYPRAVLAALLFISANYVIPILVGVSLYRDYGDWEDGTFVDIARNFHEYLGVWVLIAAVVSALGIFNSAMASYSRAMWKLADYSMLPRPLAQMRANKAPVAAIVAHGLWAIAMSKMSFDSILEISNFLSGCSLLIEKLAFIYLKWRHPRAVRPFEVPGGLAGGVLIATPVITMIVFMLCVASWTTWLASGGSVLVITLLFWPWKWGWLAKLHKSWGPQVGLTTLMEETTLFEPDDLEPISFA